MAGQGRPRFRYRVGMNPENLLVAVNMAQSIPDLVDRMYLCPAIEGGFEPRYIHYPARYMAAYVDKGARYVAEVRACIRVSNKNPDEILWKFTEDEDKRLIIEARAAMLQTRSTNRLPPRLVFLLGQPKETALTYDLKGGLQMSRVYFDITALEATDLPDLAQKLKTVSWSQLPRWKPKVETPAAAARAAKLLAEAAAE